VSLSAPGDAPPPEPGGTVTVASRLGGFMRSGGVLVPVLTAFLAFLAGGVVVLATGANPLSTYKAIFEGSGLNWLFPWVTGDDRTLAALNLQQTLIITTPLILLGLAVAIAFRAGLFNIGGQGQFNVGAMAAVFIATRMHGLPGVLHILLAIAAAMAAGGLWAGIAGFLRARTGANEVISTIMLNYTAIYLGLYLFGQGGPLQNDTDKSVPVSADIAQNAHLPVFWGDPELQGAHVGIFIALLGALLAWVLLERSVAGYRIKAVGFNPDAAEYGGISSGGQIIRAMLICGALAGLAGSLDILGWQFRVATNDIQISQLGFYGIAIALLGRNTPGGTVLAALLFGALLNGTSVRNLDPAVFDPALASNLTYIIQGLIVLLVSAPIIGTKLLGLIPGRKAPPKEEHRVVAVDRSEAA
jgi:general nucleoside transport system permease protein